MSWTKQTWFEESGHGQEELYLVAAIKKHLLSEEDKVWLQQTDYSIEDLLNGRTDGRYEYRVLRIFSNWNAKLGWKEFGF